MTRRDGRPRVVGGRAAARPPGGAEAQLLPRQAAALAWVQTSRPV